MNTPTPNQMALIKQYLKNRVDTEIIGTGFPFITISRQSAAGGHTLARCVLQEMDKHPDEDLFRGWEMFDEKLCAVVAQSDVDSVSYESLVSEDYQTGLHQAIYDILIGHSEQFSTYKRIFEVVKTLASIGKVIVIGRAGVFVTAQMPAGIHLRLVAEEAKRVKWARERLEVTEAKAVEIVRKQDRDRERLVKDFFDKDINEAAHYDAIFNTGRLEHDVLAGIILDMIRSQGCRARS